MRPVVHHRDLVAHVLDHPEVVGDEEIGEVVLALEAPEEVQDLRLHGDVEGRHRLVADDELRLRGERPRNAEPLALAARELVREEALLLGAEPHVAEELGDPARPLGRGVGCRAGRGARARRRGPAGAD